ncbi:MAG: AAA family ATPase [Geobacteraceae bacterium GWC2_58_44]|nr:MAG: AAA family ATPase [Geobacteraceae bacterium GWC2_58_44]HBG03997.1 AAA family ATPase [Geobacter sp.]
MTSSYRQFFGLHNEPFTADIKRKDILVTPSLKGVEERIHYALRIGGIAVITGEIGSGKSTALRYVIGGLHPSEHRIVYVTASSGSILELYRQILGELGVSLCGSSRALMTQRIKQEIVELVQGKKMKAALVIDEASLLRLEVFAELHTLTQFDQDSKPFLPIVLAGQSNLVDNLRYRNCLPLASRVVAKTHLQGSDQKTMEEYLRHHLGIAGVKQMLFDETAVTAIHQGSGGLFRKANHLARGALVAAARGDSQAVTAEHVRLAATELILTDGRVL